MNTPKSQLSVRWTTMTGKRSLAVVSLTLTVASLFSINGCSKQAAAGFKMPPTAIEMAIATPSTVTDRFEAVGTVEASDAITVVSQIDALVVSLPFKEGEPIEKGGLIAQLDNIQLRAEEARAEAIRDQKKISFDRIKSIVDQGAGAPQDLDNAAAELKIAEADLSLIRARLDKTRIVAPFAGTLGARRISPGAFLRAGAPITDLAALDRLKVTFSAPERYYQSLTKGAVVTVSTTAFPDYELRGTIDVIEPVVDQSTRSALIIAHIDNPGRKFRPGMSANVSAVLSQRMNALTIPDEAVFAERDQSFVFAIKSDSTVTRAPIVLGTRLRGSVEVLKGLAVGEKIVRAGHQKLYEGAKIIPIVSQTPKPDTILGANQ
jgi:membrane fusion protein, multidrug efflux system